MCLNEINNIIIENPLYSEYIITNENYEILPSIFFREYTIDFYCMECKKEATFKSNPVHRTKLYNKNSIAYARFEISEHEQPPASETERKEYKLKEFWNKTHPLHLKLTCQRDNYHVVYFSFLIRNNNLFKIGQYPSSATIDQASLHKYKKVLSQEKYKEFNTGVGLASHGVGIGSFVYLRRVFEDLIEESHQKAKEEVQGWDEDEFIHSKMNEKIKILEGFLPKFLVENRRIYGLLSKGIHELDENVCRDMFPSVKVAIELILDEKITEKERQSKMKAISQFVAQTTQKLKSQ